MQLGKHLGNNESHADVQAKDTAMKHGKTEFIINIELGVGNDQ